MKRVSLLPNAPELNPVGHLWDELREKAFANVLFNSLESLEDHMEVSLRAMELDIPRVHSTVGMALDYKCTVDLEMELWGYLFSKMNIVWFLLHQ